ncbi:MAG: Choline-sulfatase [Verrucomicrobiota bacterium]
MRSSTPLLALMAACLGAADRPNIVLIIGEDMGPDIGAYGCKDAITPHMDRLAREGALFTRAFTHAGVCAPSRSGMVTGQYPLKYGGQNMRSVVVDPPKPFTEKLRASGYQVMWPGKTDFQGVSEKELADDRKAWVQPSKSPAGVLSPRPKEPFFAYFNDTVSHESQVRASDAEHARNTAALKPSDRRDPSKVELPPFYPDTPAVRREVAHYHELVTAVDYSLGRVLDWLKAHDLEKNTVVILTGDHGRGMPRFKRSPKDTGTRVPLIVRWPGKIAPGTVREDFASWIDFAPTALTLAGVPVPAEFDGHCFLPTAVDPPKHVFAFRDYMDESYDRVRSVRDSRYRYVRNLAPGVDEAGKVAYQEVGQTMHELRRMQSEGKLSPVQALYFATDRPREQLYDTLSDPWEVKDLAADPAHAAKLAELRAECDRWIARCGPKGEMTVDELVSKGVIKPRDPGYEERAKTGKVDTSNRKKNKK